MKTDDMGKRTTEGTISCQEEIVRLEELGSEKSSCIQSVIIGGKEGCRCGQVYELRGNNKRSLIYSFYKLCGKVIH